MTRFCWARLGGISLILGLTSCVGVSVPHVEGHYPYQSTSSNSLRHDSIAHKKRNLLLASIQGDTIIVKEILDSGIDPNFTVIEPPGYPMRPLGEAVRNGHYEVVKLLVEHGANPSEGIAVAAGKNDFVIAKYLLDSGADIDSDVPIYHAAARGYVEMVKFLLDHGADPTRTIYSETPYDIARSHYHPESISSDPTMAEINTRYYQRYKDIMDLHEAHGGRNGE